MRALLLSLLVAVAVAPSPDQPSADIDWATVPNGGVSIRPFVSDLSVTTGGVTTTLFSGLTTAASSPPLANQSDGDLTVVVSALNLCRNGQTTMCYPTPNRVAVYFGYKAYMQVITELAGGSVDATTLIDATIQLNSLGSTLRWTWLNADMQYWQASGLGTNAGSIRVKFKPAYAPNINWTANPNTGCTATPIRDCAINQASGAAILSAQLVFSLDHTLDQALQGAAFATTGAIIGYLNPQGNTNPTLEYQLSSSHFQADGTTLQLGSIRGFLSQSTISSLYPGLTTSSQAITELNVTRQGSGDTRSMNVGVWTAATHGMDGIVIEIDGITFSSPSYLLKRNGASGSATAASVSMITLLGVAVAFFTRS